MKLVNSLLNFIMYVALAPLVLVSLYVIYDSCKVSKSAAIDASLVSLVNQDGDEVFDALEEESEYTIAWLRIGGTNINYPVMQNSEYYLRRNIYKEYSTYGTPFLADYCNINLSDNLIIYGHHIKSGMMFADLNKYKSYDYYLNHKTIKLYKLQETETIEEEYKIISCFKTTVNKGGFKYYNFFNATSEADYNSFVEQCRELSFYNIEDTAKYRDKLITLSTCEYSLNNGRMVVVAKKI